MIRVDVGHEFYPRLANRNEFQGDGKNNASDFRTKYLSFLDSEEAWSKLDAEIELDFSNVRKIGPSFANEAFAYFMKYVKPEDFKKKVVFKNLSKIQKLIIEQELDSGYSR